MALSRRSMMRLLAGAVPTFWISRLQKGFGQDTTPAPSQTTSKRTIAPGPFEPTWESLKQYRAPDWFRDAKFGIWAHWSAQCVPEQGDWYGRQMYIQGHPQYEYHVKHYGHPSQFGFMEIDNLWTAANWQPELLMDLYVKAGAKYFMSLANHHDNFDNYQSSHHAWNSVRFGPKKDIVGTWATIARQRGLRFAVSNHSAHSWHWFQTAYGYDPEGPLAGARYDAFHLTKEDGKGKWWEGLDPQELYNGPLMVMPEGIKTIEAARQWHDQHDAAWTEAPPPNDPAYANQWFLRCQELIDLYQPDLLYFDNTELPLGQAGLDAAAHYYNSNILARGGKLDAVLTSKGLKPEHMGTMVLDIERGRSDEIMPDPWQTDTCIGNWHYDRSIFEQHRYKTTKTVIHMLADIVSKNGNLMLSIPVRGDGTIDDDEQKILADLASWMPANGEAIFATRPFSVYGEGAPDVKGKANFNESHSRPYTSEDIRFTTKGDTLYAIALGWPNNRKLVIKTLAPQTGRYPREVGQVSLLGNDGKLPFTRDEKGLTITLPPQKPNDFAYALRIDPA